MMVHPYCSNYFYTSNYKVMQKGLLLLLFITGNVAAMAQIKKLPVAMQSNIQTSRVDSVAKRPQTDLRKPIGKDLRVALASIEKNTSNFAIGAAGIYTINFDLINAGGEDIDITGVVVQGYLNNATGSASYPQGGYVLKTGAPNFPANPVLRPGEKYRGQFLKTGFNPVDNNGNKFVIKVDNSNIVAESNENNNTLEIPVMGSLESWTTPLPDLTFQVNSITPVTGSTFLNTSLDVSLVNIGAGEIPVDVLNKIIPMIQAYPAGSPGTNLYNETYPLATRVIGNQTYPGYNSTNAPLKPGGKIRIGGTVRVNGLTSGATIVFHCTIGTTTNEVIPDANPANNTVDFLYTVK